MCMLQTRSLKKVGVSMKTLYKQTFSQISNSLIVLRSFIYSGLSAISISNGSPPPKAETLTVVLGSAARAALKLNSWLQPNCWSPQV